MKSSAMSGKLRAWGEGGGVWRNPEIAVLRGDKPPLSIQMIQSSSIRRSLPGCLCQSGFGLNRDWTIPAAPENGIKGVPLAVSYA